MRLLYALVLGVSALGAAPSQELEKARQELQKVQELVNAGSLPKARLAEAKQAVEEAEEELLLRDALHGKRDVADLTPELAEQMTATARSLLTRQQERVTRQRRLVEQGVAAPGSLQPLLQQMEQRRLSLELAESRARLWNQLLEMARAEQTRQAELEAEQVAALQAAEADPTYGILSPASLRRLATEFERTFARELPVSAKGDTVFHRSIGFDHRGRVDVALSPDTPEGRWLRSWLDASRIPYLSFAGAVPGQATAPHIHIGPPSLRLRTTD